MTILFFYFGSCVSSFLSRLLRLHCVIATINVRRYQHGHDCAGEKNTLTPRTGKRIKWGYNNNFAREKMQMLLINNEITREKNTFVMNLMVGGI